MTLERAGMLALLMQPEALPSLFAIPETDAPAAPRSRAALGDWQGRLRHWLGRDTPHRTGFWNRSAASW